MTISIINVLLYYLFCKKEFSETSIRLLYDKTRFRDVFSFVGWTLLGQAAVVGCNQGNAILVNMFHSVAANAAMTIGNQVSSTVNNLAGNFQTAFNPQITKSYAEGDYDYLRSLVFTTSKISYCLLFVVALPICINIDWVLDIWLEEVPAMSNIFCILCIANGILNALSAPLNFCVLATGRIKWFQIITAIVYFSDLLVLYLLFRLGMPPATAMWVKVSIMVGILLVRLFYANREIPAITISSFLRNVIMPLTLMSVLSIALALPLVSLFRNTYLRILLTVVVILVNVSLVWLLTLNRNERKAVMRIIRK
jgi:O-antigen/teichoic acid export membrane protein